MKLFKPIEDTNNLPVINKVEIQHNILQGELLQAYNFNKELSSVKGVQSQRIYIARINTISAETNKPIMTILGSDLIHINTQSKPIITGTYGKTWMKTKRVICNPDEQADEIEIIEEIKEEVKPIITNKYLLKYGKNS